MLSELTVATFLVACLAIFVAANLYNMKKSSVSKKEVKYKAEVELPQGLIFVLAAFGTGIFFLETILYAFLVFAGLHIAITDSILQLRFPFDSWVQSAGVFLISSGYALFIWSVLARGRYATSWAMPEDQRLVTWGPYKYVRHPSYLAYFLLFIGLFLTLLNLLAAVPFIAILGYVRIAAEEEKLLVKRFGEAYLAYQHTTGMFVPRRKRQA